MRYACQLPNGGSAPATLGFNAVTPEWLLSYGAADAAPAVPAAESTLGSHPCVALSSAQVLPEWINRNLAANAFSSNGDNPLNFVSHSRGSLQKDSCRGSKGGSSPVIFDGMLSAKLFRWASNSLSPATVGAAASRLPASITPRPKSSCRLPRLSQHVQWSQSAKRHL